MYFLEHSFAPLGTFTCIPMGLENPLTNFWLRGYLSTNSFFFFKLNFYLFSHRPNVSVSEVIR